MKTIIPMTSWAGFFAVFCQRIKDKHCLPRTSVQLDFLVVLK
jgi:hypothetical protein